MNFSWAKEYPEVHKICTLFQMSEISNPKRYSYRPLNAYLQEGPQCGLVALAMCTGLCDATHIKELFESAKSQNYTCNGEMFSVPYMANLARQHLPHSSFIEIYDGFLNVTRIKELLLDGGIILVPYDTDKDNSPGLYSGHKAHWAIVSGGIETEDNFFVLARHGKAKNVSIWRLSDLSESNSQLIEFSPDRKLDTLEYKLPEGGICGPLGLNKKSVLIKFES